MSLLFFHWAKGISRPQKWNHLVSTLDILPTLVDAAGGKIPEGIDGKSLFPLLGGQSEAPVHDYLLGAGLHSRAWGFLLNKSYKTHVTEREFAPPTWVVVKPPYLLRYVGIIEPQVYTEQPEGGSPVYELFDYVNDPSETNNIAQSKPEKVEELKAIFMKESQSFPPPVVWEEAKWEEIRGGYIDP